MVVMLRTMREMLRMLIAREGWGCEGYYVKIVFGVAREIYENYNFAKCQEVNRYSINKSLDGNLFVCYHGQQSYLILIKMTKQVAEKGQFLDFKYVGCLFFKVHILCSNPWKYRKIFFELLCATSKYSGKIK